MTPGELARTSRRTITSLPRPRSDPHDNHHLFWSREQMRKRQLTDLRELPCAIIWQGDSLIHTLTHIVYPQDGLVIGDQRQGYDLWVQAGLALRRHQERQCSCIERSRLIVIDAFSLEVLTPEQPPCMGYTVDYELVALMRRYYRPRLRVSDDLRQLLRERCQNRTCACALQDGHNIHRPLGWNLDLPQSA